MAVIDENNKDMTITIPSNDPPVVLVVFEPKQLEEGRSATIEFQAQSAPAGDSEIVVQYRGSDPRISRQPSTLTLGILQRTASTLIRVASMPHVASLQATSFLS